MGTVAQGFLATARAYQGPALQTPVQGRHHEDHHPIRRCSLAVADAWPWRVRLRPRQGMGQGMGPVPDAGPCMRRRARHGPRHGPRHARRTGGRPAGDAGRRRGAPVRPEGGAARSPRRRKARGRPTPRVVQQQCRATPGAAHADAGPDAGPADAAPVDRAAHHEAMQRRASTHFDARSEALTDLYAVLTPRAEGRWPTSGCAGLRAPLAQRGQSR